MTALPQTKSFPWKWNDCMTDSMNHEYVNSSWTRPCLAISLWGILFRNQTTLYQSFWGFCDYHSCLEHESGLVQKKSIKDEEMWLNSDNQSDTLCQLGGPRKFKI